uniref:Uncharacterized protein n=1 Tax=Amphimedon queenslandica TaxID=400682 RepID=A0A1X7SQF8_AMPQE
MGVCCRCDDHKKLTQIPLDPSLQVQVLRSESEKRSYDTLKPALAKPFRLTAELRKLFYKAYPPTYHGHGTPEAELLGKSVSCL